MWSKPQTYHQTNTHVHMNTHLHTWRNKVTNYTFGEKCFYNWEDNVSIKEVIMGEENKNFLHKQPLALCRNKKALCLKIKKSLVSFGHSLVC